MTPQIMATLYGLVGIGSAILCWVMGRAAWCAAPQDGRPFRLFAGGFSALTGGLAVMCSNRVSEALYAHTLPALVLLGGITIVASAIAVLVGSTSLGGNRLALRIYLIAGALWFGFCMAHSARPDVDATGKVIATR